MGREHSKHCPRGDLGGSCARQLTVHEAMQTLPVGPMLHYSITNRTARSQLQISAHCISLQIIAPHQKQQDHSP